jgi:SAM-dependent methyltransferase
MNVGVPPMTIHAWLRYDAFRRLLPADVETVLEIGAGRGAVGALLARRFRYVGLEPDLESFSKAAVRIGDSGSVLQVREETYASDKPFDVVCAFEVLEHLEDDHAALERWQRHLRPGGVLFLSVPAGRDRFGPPDVKAGHYRRYDREDLDAVLRRAGLTDTRVVAYGFPIGYLLEAGRNLIVRGESTELTFEQRTAASGRWLQAPAWAATPLRLLAMPFQQLQRPFWNSRLGTGLVARARKATE